jgi:putative tryptophan/tyrosine transport system substrate-binding protein
MNTKSIVLVLAFLVFLFVPLADAQQPEKKVHRIGYLSLRAGIEPREEAFLKGLREIGYVDGQNIVVIEWRFAKGKEDLLPGLAAEIVQLNPVVVVAAGNQAVQAMKRATTTIPIVFGQVSDPVGVGFVASLERPGGNITGLTTSASDLSRKRLELVKETFPAVTRVALLLDARNPAHKLFLKDMEAVSPALGMQVQSLEVRRLDEVDDAFQAALNARAEALIVTASGIFITNKDRERLANLAIKARLPVLHAEQAFVIAGGLMSYATDIPEQFRRAAIYVDKILKGAKPAEISVEEPTKFELVINLKAAKEIGLTIPPSVLARADRVIQ